MRPGTRLLILDAADSFLKTHSFHDLTVTSLMRATNLSRAAFYQYFRNRHDIAAALMERLAEAATEPVAAMFDTETDPIALTDTGIRSTINNLAPRAHLLKALVEAAGEDRRVDQVWRRTLMHPYVDAIAKRIRLDQASGAAPSTLDPEVVGVSLFIMTVRVMSEYSHSLGDRVQRERLAQTLSRIWCAALYGRY